MKEDECGALVEWYWQGKHEVPGENPVLVRWNDTDRGNLKYPEKTLS